MPYTLTTYEGEKIKLMEQSPERIRDLAGEAGMIAIQDSNGQIHYLGKGRLASINYTKPEGLVVRPEQRLAMGDQKDNRSTGSEAEAARAWREHCGHDFKLMGDKEARDQFIKSYTRNEA